MHIKGEKKNACYSGSMNWVVQLKKKTQETSHSREFSRPKMKRHFRLPPTYVNLIIKQILINHKQ